MNTLTHTNTGAEATIARDAVVDITGLNKWYGNYHALKNINLQVQSGEQIVICGPSGSGKSTLIRSINQLETHESGTIMINGREIAKSTPRIHEMRRDIGMVFQHFNLFPHLTVLRNCTL